MSSISNVDLFEKILIKCTIGCQLDFREFCWGLVTWKTEGFVMLGRSECSSMCFFSGFVEKLHTKHKIAFVIRLIKLQTDSVDRGIHRSYNFTARNQ